MKLDIEKIAMLGALGLAAYWLTTKTALGAQLGLKPAVPQVWAQNPTRANDPQMTNTQAAQSALIGAGVNAGVNWLSSLFSTPSTAQINAEMASELAYYGTTNWDGSATNSPAAYSNVWQENAQNYSRGDW